MYFWMYVKFNYENKLDLYVCIRLSICTRFGDNSSSCFGTERNTKFLNLKEHLCVYPGLHAVWVTALPSFSYVLILLILNMNTWN